MKAIQEERQKLLRVMLVWTTKLRRMTTYRFLRGRRGLIRVSDEIGNITYPEPNRIEVGKL